MTIQQELRDYFSTFFKEKIGETDNLFQIGALDSMGIVSLIQHIEAKLNISVDPDEITAENFSSLHNIEALLKIKKPA